ncbi:hypothetical protein AGMMS49921_08710 [Endomicrobiia bacterium]|nr:hypothetical protein AGMMS49921_08710 [Endomicrobiia bacterium]
MECKKSIMMLCSALMLSSLVPTLGYASSPRWLEEEAERNKKDKEREKFDVEREKQIAARAKSGKEYKSTTTHYKGGKNVTKIIPPKGSTKPITVITFTPSGKDGKSKETTSYISSKTSNSNKKK